MKSIEILEKTPLIMKDLFSGLSEEWLMSNEGAGSWNPLEILCHLIHCEEDDWIRRTKIILSESKEKEFEPFNRTLGFEKIKSKKTNELLNEFALKRRDNLKYLLSLQLQEKDFNREGIHPEFGKVTLKELLSAWVVHDLNHIAQVCRVMSNQFAGEVGPWKEYLSILKK